MIHLKAKEYKNLIRCGCYFIIHRFTITVLLHLDNKPVVHIIAELRHGTLEKIVYLHVNRCN